ncbi:MAG: NAD(P)-dependent oxidoreductase [Thaumarchaeota archaeon]|nr:NAD(P)-dependent oxidoreductase [Nitrososphaerota archaeon]
MRVGIVGTGMLGEAVGLRLLSRGHDVAAHNRTRGRTARLASSGAAVMGSAREVAAASDVAITCVTDADAVRAVTFGVDGLAAGAHAGLVIADMSTICPDDSREISRRLLSEHGVRMIGVPVMGGPDAAAAGELVVMADGDAGAIKACEPALRDISGEIHRLGESGTAHTIKLAMNLQIASLAISISEGIELARRGGADPEDFLKVLNSTYFATGMSRKKAHRMARGEYPPTFLLRNLEKDISMAVRLAGSRGASLPGALAARAAYGEAVRAGHGGLDYTGILRHISGP